MEVMAYSSVSQYLTSFWLMIYNIKVKTIRLELGEIVLET